jgi:hypothetical protein
MRLIIFVLIILSLGSNLYGDDLYPSCTLLYYPLKFFGYSDDRALAYITTVRLFDYDHYIYISNRRYPSQYFYTNEIQMNDNSEKINEFIYNTTTSDYEYNFQPHLDSR